jgi:hypothetical protein
MDKHTAPEALAPTGRTRDGETAITNLPPALT